MPYKVCPKCNHKNGPRTLKCKGECGHEFESASIRNPKAPKKPKNKVPKMVEVDYHKLEKGEKVKVVKGSGPYRINGGDERVSFGDYGEFYFQYTLENGFIGLKKGLTHFIYMGPDRELESGTFLVAHKVLAKERFDEP